MVYIEPYAVCIALKWNAMHLANKLPKYWFKSNKNVSAAEFHLLIFKHVLFCIVPHADKSLEMDQAIPLSWH